MTSLETNTSVTFVAFVVKHPDYAKTTDAYPTVVSSGSAG